MARLSDQTDFVVGVDTHKASHTAAVVDRQGAHVATTTRPADAAGYQRLVAFARQQAPGRRVWAVEGSGSYGRGLVTYLLERRGGQRPQPHDLPAEGAGGDRARVLAGAPAAL